MARQPAAHNASGGVGVSVRRGTGIVGEAVGLIPDAFAHRLVFARVGSVVGGGVHCLSVYLRDSEGLTPANIAILECVAVMVCTLGGPSIIGGDSNVTPQPDLLRMGTATAKNTNMLVNFAAYKCTAANALKPGSCPTADPGQCIKWVSATAAEL